MPPHKPFDCETAYTQEKKRREDERRRRNTEAEQRKLAKKAPAPVTPAGETARREVP